MSQLLLILIRGMMNRQKLDLTKLSWLLVSTVSGNLAQLIHQCDSDLMHPIQQRFKLHQYQCFYELSSFKVVLLNIRLG